MAIASELAQVVWRLGDLCHFYRSFNWRIKCAVCFEITLQRPLRNPDTEFVTRYRNRISFLQLQGHFQANQVKIGNSDVKFRRFYFLMDQIMLDWHGGLSFFRLFLCLPAFSSVFSLACPSFLAALPAQDSGRRGNNIFANFTSKLW